MTHDEFLAVVEKCRDQRGALYVVRDASVLLERPPRVFGQLAKALQEWTQPVTIDRTVRLVIQILDREDPENPNVVHAKDLMSALLLATGERAAEHERDVPHRHVP